MSGISTESAEPGGARAGFARKASGLVRDFSQLDAWIYNVLAINIVLNVALSYALVAVTYPRASIWLALVLAGIFCTFEAIVYAIFTTAMPRSGGDYVFQSRVLGGGVATMFAFTAVTLSQIIWMALAGWFGANLILSPFLTLLGGVYNWGWAVDAGEWFAKDIGVFTMGVVSIAWASFVNIRGLRVYAYWQRYFFWVGLACLAIVTVAMLFSSNADFQNNLNHFMSTNYGVSNAYDKVIQQGGTTDVSFSLGQTLLATVIASFALIYPAWSVQQAGEIKRASSLKGNVRSIVGAEVFSFIVVAIVGALLYDRVGQEFLYAAGTSYYEGTESVLPVAPFFGFFAALVSTAPIFVWISFVMFFAWYWMWFPNIMVGGTRVVLAMSFDKVLPSWFGKVDRHTHSPVNATIAMAAASLVMVALYSFVEAFLALTLGLLVLNITGFAATMVAGAVFPWKRRDMYRATPAARHTVFGIPLISIAAVIFLGFVVFVDIQALRADELGINGTKGLLLVGGTYVVAALIYIGSKIYRRRRENLDLSLVYRELPSE
jgi:amino acid transporter